MDNDKKLFEALLKADGIDPSGPTESERLIFRKMLDRQLKPKQTKPAFRPDLWRIIMKSKFTKLAAAAVIIIAAFVGIHYSGGTIDIAVPAYGFEQTVSALKSVRAVRMFCKDWNGAKFEMWMQLDEAGRPQRCRSHWPDYGVTNISTPEKSYQYNEKMKMVIVKTGELYSFGGLSFDNIFENLLAAAKQNPEHVTIHREADRGKALIVVTADMGNSVWKLFIDPQTKLPTSVYCLKSNQSGQFIRDIDEIYYDEQLPSRIFEFNIPEGASVQNSDDSVKRLNDPNYGLAYNSLTEQQAAEEIASEYWQAVIDCNLIQMKKYYPDTNANYTKEEIESKYKQYYGDYVAELVEVGVLYIEHNCGLGKLLPCTLKLKNGTLVECKIIIRFRNIGGVQSCVIAGNYGAVVKIE